MQTCASCRHWKVVSEAPDCREGVCRKLADSSWHGGWQTTDAADSCESWTKIVYFQATDGARQVDRRLAERTRVNYPTRLQTPGGTRSVRLTDLSLTGARLVLSDPPKAGLTALIQLGAKEMFCRIAWSGDNCCGLEFEKPLPNELVAAITGNGMAQAIPLAQPAIPPQRKTFGLRGVAQPLRAMAKP